MRTTLFAALVILGLSSATSAQVLQIDMTDGQFRAGMRPVETPYATGGPWAALPAKGVRTDKYNARRITLTASTIDIATLVERARYLRAATLTR